SKARKATHLESDGNHHTYQYQRTRQLVAQNAFNDVRHQWRLGRVEFCYWRPIGPDAMRTVNAGIDEIDCLAAIVHKVTLRRSATRIDPLPRAIALRVHVGLRAFDSLPRAQLGIVRRAQVGQKVA